MFCVASFQGKKDDDGDEEEEKEDAPILLSTSHNSKGFLNESNKKKDFYQPTSKIKDSISFFPFLLSNVVHWFNSTRIWFRLIFCIKLKKKKDRSFLKPKICFLFVFVLNYLGLKSKVGDLNKKKRNKNSFN